MRRQHALPFQIYVLTLCWAKPGGWTTLNGAQLLVPFLDLLSPGILRTVHQPAHMGALLTGRRGRAIFGWIRLAQWILLQLGGST